MFDSINGLFELLASLFILNHCRVLYNQKSVAGVSVISTIFFAAWGIWNTIYYPHLGQMRSFYCGLGVAAANGLWVTLMLHYKRK